MNSRHETIAMPDGGEMSAYVALPGSGGGPGMLVLMEIFGVGTYIRGACDRLANHGYVALAPDLYRRAHPGAEFGHDEAGLQRAFAASQDLDLQGAIEDAVTALEHLDALPETTLPSGVLGFCLGGTLAFGVAQQGYPATTVAYYGSGIPAMLEEADAITCPLLLHFGGDDPYIPRTEIDAVAAAAEARPIWELHLHEDGGHAFDNWDSPMFHRPEPARRAWEQTSDFLARTLPLA